MVNKSMKKLNKRLMVMVLTGMMLTASIPVMATEPNERPQNPKYSSDGVSWTGAGTFESTNKDHTEWSYIYFGFYPQTEVTDTATKSAIDAALIADGGKTTGDAMVDGKKYRKISKADTNWTGFFGKDEYRYFKWNPIRWKVLQVDDEKNSLFVLADQALDCQEYNEKSEAITWEGCTLRKWLNGETFEENSRSALTKKSFIETAFDEDQKGIILATAIENKDHPNPEWNTPGGNATTDRIFLLSYDDMIKKTYGFCEIFDNDSTTRMVVPTDYAHAMGAFKNTPTDTGYQYHGENGYWWLRTPGYGTDHAMDCLLGGTGDYYGSRVNKEIYGVVPALYLNLSSDLWSMKEDGVHLGGGEGGGKSTDTETETQKPGDGSAKQTEIAIPGKVTIGSAKNNKKGTVTIKIKTKKTDPKVEGYEVVSAISKKKLSKVKKGKTFKKASIKLTKLKKGKTYYIKIRAFNKDAEGKNVYGEWSKVIKIKVKK